MVGNNKITVTMHELELNHKRPDYSICFGHLKKCSTACRFGCSEVFIRTMRTLKP